MDNINVTVKSKNPAVEPKSLKDLTAEIAEVKGTIVDINASVEQAEQDVERLNEAYNNSDDFIIGPDNKMKRKPKAYAPAEYSGLGEIYLDKNMKFLGREFEEFVSNPNVPHPGTSIGDPDGIVYDRVRQAFLGYRNIEGSRMYTDTWDEQADYTAASGYKYLCTSTDTAYKWQNGDLVETAAINGNVLTQAMLDFEHTIYHIQYDYDLNGRTIEVPEGCVLQFEGGSLRHGTLVGDNTKIQYIGTIFDGITINGTWLVPIIKTSMFANCTEQDVLKNVFALQNSNIQNEIIVETALSNYLISLEDDIDINIIGSKTKLVIDGNIEIVSNSSPSYRIVSLYGSSIQVVGTGKIIGDRLTHTYTEGSTHEYGHGLFIGSGSTDITINGIEIYDCTGDAIYQRSSGKDIKISNVHLHHCRRQGITIQGIENIIIENFNIHDISGVNPQSAIDMEPNIGENATCRNITIRNGNIYNTRLGIVNSITSSPEEDRVYENVIIDNVVLNCTLQCIVFEQYKGVSIKNITAQADGYVIVNNCDIEIENSQLITPIENVAAIFNDYNYRTIIRNSKMSGHYALRYSHNIIIDGCIIDSNRLFKDVADASKEFGTIKNSIINSGFEVLKYNIDINNCNINCYQIYLGTNISIRNNTLLGKATTTTTYFILYDNNHEVANNKITNNRISIPNGTYRYIADIKSNTRAIVYGNNIIGSTIAGKKFSANSLIGNYILDFCGANPYGTSSERPNLDPTNDAEPLFRAFSYFDSDKSKPSWWTGGRWVESDGANINAERKGATTDRPAGNLIYVGFQFFDTTLGKPVYASAIGASPSYTVTWVDATGATV